MDFKSLFLILFFLLRFASSSEGQSDVENTKELDLSKYEASSLNRLNIPIVQGVSSSISIPVIILKGKRQGPTIGIVAGIHGNEVNGIAIIHELVNKINTEELSGTIVFIPGINTPGIERNQREYINDEDLNRLFPGKAQGTESQQFAYHFYHKVISKTEILLDLHTASFGRENSLYIRASKEDTLIWGMALAHGSDILLNSDGTPSAANSGSGETLRAWAIRNNIPAITIEYGNPQVFQESMIHKGAIGITNILCYLQMLKKKEKLPIENPVLCKKSYWIYTDKGGFLYDVPPLKKRVSKGDIIGTLKDSYGRIITTYYAPEKGIIIGRSSNPVAQSGSRIIHLGIEP